MAHLLALVNLSARCERVRIEDARIMGFGSSANARDEEVPGVSSS